MAIPRTHFGPSSVVFHALSGSPTLFKYRRRRKISARVASRVANLERTPIPSKPPTSLAAWRSLGDLPKPSS